MGWPVQGLRGAAAWVCVLGGVPQAHAQSAQSLIEFEFVPTHRSQIALWIESADGMLFETVRLTQSVAYRGIGNRPGATQMNSGFRWPYGRREGVLPVWAHRRVEAGHRAFPRVIFQKRTSEGHASRSTTDFSRDDYYCLTFDREQSRREGVFIDGMTCASVFNSDKGRYLTGVDVEHGYAEPWEDLGGADRMRRLPLTSFYPPRRDVVRCTASGCSDHPDVDSFAADARVAMPEIDAVTMATPAGRQLQIVRFSVPKDWKEGDYIAWLEVHTEGDYNDVFNPETYPTPESDGNAWDTWAVNFGFPYRGQPSVVYRVPFTLGPEADVASASTAFATGDLHGADGDLYPVTDRVIDDPETAPGSGADRLFFLDDDVRFRVRTVPNNLCAGATASPTCGQPCDAESPCPDGFVCEGAEGCTGLCEATFAPGAPGPLSAEPVEDARNSHRWAQLRFAAASSVRSIAAYDVRVSNHPIGDAQSFERALPASEASVDSVGLSVPTDVPSGNEIRVAIGGLNPASTYFIAVRAVDVCNAPGPMVTTAVTTTQVQFTTVSPCFIATAAYGTPLASEIDVLRRFRDRYLMSHALGRLFVSAYYAAGPFAAGALRERERLRWAVRMALTPMVALARWLDRSPELAPGNPETSWSLEKTSRFRCLRDLRGFGDRCGLDR